MSTLSTSPLSPKLSSRITLAVPSTSRSLIVCSQGMEGVGKTAWSLTAATPSRPGLYIPLDRANIAPYINNLIRTRKVYIPKVNYRINDPRKVDKTQAQKSLGELEEIIMDALSPSSPIAGVILDTASYYWMLVRLAEFGKIEQVMPHMYGPANTRFESIFHRAEETGKWVVAIHKYGKQYAKGKDGKDSWNGLYERKGYGDMGFIANVIVENYRTTVEGEGGDGTFTTTYGCKILENKLEGKEIGACYEGDENTFGWMGFQCFPETDPEDWGITF